MSHYTDTEYNLSKSTVLNINPKAGLWRRQLRYCELLNLHCYLTFDTEGQNSGAHIKILP